MREIQLISMYLGGLWEPYASGDTSIERMNYWSKLTYQYYNRLYRSQHASSAGIQQIPVYNYTEEDEVSISHNIHLT